MGYRLETGGRLIDRSAPIPFTFNGETFEGFEGDTLASALLANDKMLVGRSFKYHRPRGIVASGAEEPNALLGVGTGARFEPNQRATTTELHAGLEARSQNHWPSLEFDVGAINDRLAGIAPVFSAGFYYKTFMYPRVAWKHVYEPFIRRAAGLGRAPEERDPDTYEHFHFFTDLLVVGGGIAGLTAARAAAETGARVLLVEQTSAFGGRALVDETEIDGMPAADWADAQVAALSEMPNVTLRTRLSASGLYDHGYALLLERVAEHRPGLAGAPRHRLWRVRARQTVVASGAIERPLTFAMNDVPGVMLASAVRDYVGLYGVSPGRRAVIVANNDDAYRTALALHGAGVAVAAVLDTRREAAGALPQAVRDLQIPVRESAGIAKVLGKTRVKGVQTGRLSAGKIGAAGETIECDLVAMSGGWSPVVHLYSHCGGRLAWDDTGLMFRPHPEAGAPIGRDGQTSTRCAGAANGELSTAAGLADAQLAGRAAAAAAGFAPRSAEHAPQVSEPDEAPIAPHWFTPSREALAHGTKHFVDFQNDVTVADIRLAAREGYESVEHTKRYTTLGMATDQGKTSNITGLAILADALGVPIPEVGTTTFRPPYTPISMGAIAGRAAGPLFKAVRQTPMHDWHLDNGAEFERVADWYRPFCYLRPGEDRHAAVEREVTNARARVGLLDASTLGKLWVAGPDAGELLDRIYTNMMWTLKPGRCRYGLMCNENGFLFDDGVVVRFAEDRFLCHTTSGGAERVHAHLEEWLQTEWWDLRAHVVNVTEQWAQIAVAGPEARRVIEAAGTDMDLSAEALPFMAHTEGRIAGHPVRLFRISFSGELSYEIATPAHRGRALWDALLSAGTPHGVMAYGTEALHVMRAEKGFIMIGDETDGTVTPQDLGLSWAVSKKKPDFIGKRAQARIDLARPDRKQLVGLLTADPALVLPDGAHAVEDPDAPKPQRTIGHVTSSYLSPTLGHSIAMALIERGRARMGDTLRFPLEDGTVAEARVVDPVFYDKEGTRQNV